MSTSRSAPGIAGLTRGVAGSSSTSSSSSWSVRTWSPSTTTSGASSAGVSGASSAGVSSGACASGVSSTSPCSFLLSSAIEFLLPGLQFERLRLLRGVGVVGTGVHLELGQLLASQAVAGKHALDREADDLLRTPLEHVVERAGLEASGVAGVAAVELRLALVAGDG